MLVLFPATEPPAPHRHKNLNQPTRRFKTLVFDRLHFTRSKLRFHQWISRTPSMELGVPIPWWSPCFTGGLISIRLGSHLPFNQSAATSILRLWMQGQARRCHRWAPEPCRWGKNRRVLGSSLNMGWTLSSASRSPTVGLWVGFFAWFFLIWCSEIVAVKISRVYAFSFLFVSFSLSLLVMLRCGLPYWFVLWTVIGSELFFKSRFLSILESAICWYSLGFSNVDSSVFLL